MNLCKTQEIPRSYILTLNPEAWRFPAGFTKPEGVQELDIDIAAESSELMLFIAGTVSLYS